MEEETEDHALGALGALGDLVVLGVGECEGDVKGMQGNAGHPKSP